MTENLDLKTDDTNVGQSGGGGEKTSSMGGVGNDKIFAVLAYLGILWVVPLVAAKDSDFAMYHANQGFVLFLLSIAIPFISFLPFIGGIASFAVFVFYLVLFITGILNAANGRMEPMPVIGGIKLLER